jgi:hypothetical protein
MTTRLESIPGAEPSIRGAALATIYGATHFMIATHPKEVATLIAQHVRRAEAT